MNRACKNCVYFEPYDSKSGKYYFLTIKYPHCACRRFKRCRPDMAACTSFQTTQKSS